MNHQWPPELIRAMHRFAEAAPIAPSLGSVLEHRSIASSSRPTTADLDPEERLAPMEKIPVSAKTHISQTRNRRHLVMAAAVVVGVAGIAGIAVANNRRMTGAFESGPRVTSPVSIDCRTDSCDREFVADRTTSK